MVVSYMYIMHSNSEQEAFAIQQTQTILSSLQRYDLYQA